MVLEISSIAFKCRLKMIIIHTKVTVFCKMPKLEKVFNIPIIAMDSPIAMDLLMAAASIVR
jgi:hypothetical protein